MDFLDRLKQEQIELSTKIDKLEDFHLTETYTKLSQANKILLDAQLGFMQHYRDVLLVRIELIEK